MIARDAEETRRTARSGMLTEGDLSLGGTTLEDVAALGQMTFGVMTPEVVTLVRHIVQEALQADRETETARLTKIV